MGGFDVVPTDAIESGAPSLARGGPSHLRQLVYNPSVLTPGQNMQ